MKRATVTFLLCLIFPTLFGATRVLERSKQCCDTLKYRTFLPEKYTAASSCLKSKSPWRSLIVALSSPATAPETF